LVAIVTDSDTLKYPNKLSNLIYKIYGEHQQIWYVIRSNFKWSILVMGSQKIWTYACKECCRWYMAVVVLCDTKDGLMKQYWSIYSDGAGSQHPLDGPFTNTNYLILKIVLRKLNENLIHNKICILNICSKKTILVLWAPGTSIGAPGNLLSASQ